MRAFIDLWAYLCDCTGKIPSHTIRLFLYRYVFRISIGADTSIHMYAKFNQPTGIKIGHNTIVGNDAFLDGRFKRTWKEGENKMVGYLRELARPMHHPLIIGNNVSIAGEVRIYTMEHDIDSPTFEERGEDVVIDDYVVVGTRVTILPGVHVGKGAVIATGAVVTRDVEPYSVVAGVPAKEIKKRSTDLRYTLKFARLFH